MFNRIKKLGPVAFATYTSISVVSFSSWMTAFYFGLDPDLVDDKMKDIKSYFGYSTSPELPNESSHTKDRKVSSFGKLGTIVVLSVMAHQLIMPLRLALTAALTPHVNRQLIKRNIDLYAWFNKRI